MANTVVPFLYRTRTLQRAWRAPVLSSTVRLTRNKSTKEDNSIPFDWGNDVPPPGGVLNEGDTPSTITPSEAHIFKGIFDEISRGKMTRFRRHLPGRRQAKPRPGFTQPRPRSIIEQARMTKFRDDVLQRYPESLRDAAQVALGLFEFGEPGSSGGNLELDQNYQKSMAERAKYERLRAEEKERVDKLMTACETDFDLWDVMQREVFSLPDLLGISQEPGATKRDLEKMAKRTAKRTATKTAQTAKAQDDDALPLDEEKNKLIMNVHGPLYSYFLHRGLILLDTAFQKPSPYAFNILPRVKELGLPSYVLGASTSFYAALARMHWCRFGDITSTLDVVEEMNETGLSADEEILEFLITVRKQIGAGGGIVRYEKLVWHALMSPPYDAVSIKRLDALIKSVQRALVQE